MAVAAPPPPARIAAEDRRPHVRRPRIIDSFDELCHESTTVPPEVAAALRAIEAIGGHDMYDREAVLRCAPCHGYAAAAAWLARNRHLYFVAIWRARAAA